VKSRRSPGGYVASTASRVLQSGRSRRADPRADLAATAEDLSTPDDSTIDALSSSLTGLCRQRPVLDRTRCPLTVEPRRVAARRSGPSSPRPQPLSTWDPPSATERTVLRANADQGNLELVSVTTGWGDITNVFVRAMVFPCQNRDEVVCLVRTAVDSVLGGTRHVTHVSWDEDGACLRSQRCPLGPND